MTVYVIAQLSIHDRGRYDRYVAGFMPVLIRYGGRLLAADETPETLEGAWTGDKVVVIAFPDRAAADRWRTSADYREISRDREAATEGSVLLVHGIDAPR